MTNTQYYQTPRKSQSTISNKVFNIRERVFNYSQKILDIGEMVPNNKICDILRTQLVRAGTSIGANLEEADGTLTKKDFINKIVIARKEAKETKYWLRLLENKYLKHTDVSNGINEAQELINIFSTIITKTKNNDK